MRISPIYNFKINRSNFIQYKPQIKFSQAGFDSFRSSVSKKVIELHELIDGRVKNPAPVIRAFMQYTGDDYEAAKILAASIKEDKSGLHFTLSKEDKMKMKMLDPECPYLQSYIKDI